MSFQLKDDRSPREKIITNSIAVLIMLGLGYWGWTKIPDFPEAAPPVPIAEADLSTNAYLLCKRHIKNNLVSPASADFPFLNFTSVNLGGQKYQVRTYVDSQNGFGAMIRTNWICDIEHDSVGGRHDETSWTLLNLEAN